MGWNEDHLLAVANRWANKYRESDLAADEFGKRMKKTLIGYGWSEPEAEKIVAKAIEKGGR